MSAFRLHITRLIVVRFSRIQRSGKTGVTIPVSVQHSDRIRAGWSILSRRELPIRVNDTAAPDFFGIAPGLPFSCNTTIPLALPGI
ncbi:MAG: hypothetical protein LUQ04_09920 [Methanoregula sp.]|nr:hypothetical protein [Methanoregula sp.]